MFKKYFLLFCLILLTKDSFAIKYAVLVGINDYQSSKIRDLNYSEADARNLYDTLIKYARFEPENIKLLLGSEATYSNIKKEIFWLGQVARPEDKVLYYFSGHGTRVIDRDHNEEDGLDEAFCPYETEIDNPASLILDDEIGYWFNGIKSDEIIVVLDCCHSGGAAGRNLIDDGSKGIDMVSNDNINSKSLLFNDTELYARDLTYQNKVILTASDADEKSYENPQLGHGVYTYYLSEGIKGQADFNHDKSITINELYDFTREKTLEFSSTREELQTPGIFGDLDENVVISEINDQLCEVILYDNELNLVRIKIDSNNVKEGDVFLIKKIQQGAKDIYFSDMEVMKIRITNIYDHYSEAIVMKKLYDLSSIKSYTNYYAEKLVTGSLMVYTFPWSYVFVDGKNVGPSPIVLNDLVTGKHKIDFRIDLLGYEEPKTVTIFIEDNVELNVHQEFEKLGRE